MVTNMTGGHARRRAVQVMARLADRALRTGGSVDSLDDGAIRRILVAKTCCVGDLLMATPVIRALHGHYPAATIDVLTTNWSAPVVETNPRVAAVVPYPDRITPSALLRLRGSLRGRRYDLAVILERSPVVPTLLRLCGIPVRAGIDSEGRGVGLTHRATPRLGQHETDVYLDVLSSIGIPANGRHPEYEVTDAARASVAGLLPGDTGPIAVIHPGGAVNPGTTMLSKRWPAEHFGVLADGLHAMGLTVVLVGSDTDRPAIEDVKRATGAPVIDLGGKISIPVLAALCERAAVYVGNDSGMSHLAAAVGTATVTIFGPTSPLRYQPLGPRSAACAPPASWEPRADVDLRRERQADPRLSIACVPVDQVLAACREVLASASEASPS